MWGIRTHKFTLRQKETLTAWVFILPILIGYSIFTFGAIIYSFCISLTKWDLLSAPEFIGFKNYIKVFKDPEFYNCMGNTLFFVIFLVPIVLVISMSLAIAINKCIGKVGKFYKISFFMPCVTATIAVSMVWLCIFNPDNGIINSILYSLGVKNPPNWLESTFWAKPSLILMRIWQMSGYYMIMFLTGLQTIPKTLYEAAKVDGATKWKRIKYITIPMLSNTTFFVLIMLIIESFNMFESIYVMTEGGPAGSTNTIMYYIYTSGFSFYKMGYASSLAWIFFAILFIFTLIRFKTREDNTN